MTDLANGTDVLPSGYVLNEYKIRAVLGRGGFGITYVAEDVYLDHVVAIKEYCPIGLAVRTGTAVAAVSESDQEKGRIFAWGLNRFVDEARILARCRHPNITRVIRYFESNGTAYLVMDFETGVELGAYRERLGRPFTENELHGLMSPLMEGLASVHRAGFLHRDIKPGNIMVRKDGTPVLLDFGAARQAMGTRSGLFTVIVTNGYAPIEQYAADGDQGPWTDVYGLGSVFYWAVTGQKPPDALSRMRRDSYQPVSQTYRGLYSERLLAAVDGALMFDPADRFRSMDEWREVLNGTRPIPRSLAERGMLAATVAPTPVAPTPVAAARLSNEMTEHEPEHPASLHADAPPLAARPSLRASAQRDPFAQRTFEGWRKTVETRPAAAGGSRPAAPAVSPPPAAPLRPAPPVRTPLLPRGEPVPAHKQPIYTPLVEPERTFDPASGRPRQPAPAPVRRPPPPAAASDATEWAVEPRADDGAGLLVLRYGDATITVPGDGREFLIGRSSSNHLVLTDAVTSRKHARIVNEHGKYIIGDLSKFGTWVQYADGHTIRLNGASDVLHGSGVIAFGAEPEIAGNTAAFRCLDDTDGETVLDVG